MKRVYLITVLMGCGLTGFAQSIVTTSSGKSGILVGSDPEDKSDFVGINYESADDKFRLNYKFVKQDKNKKNGNTYPHFWGINVGPGIKV